MKAAVLTAYGPPEVLRIEELPTPEPKAGELRIRVEASTVTAGDVELRAMKLPFLFRVAFRIYLGILKPRRKVILGQELAGTVDAVGEGVSKFAVGDKVMARTGISLGGNAEFICLPESSTMSMVAARPASLSAEEAAAIPFAAFEAHYFMRKANVRPGERVLVVGAGGSIGTYAVQIARAMGAEVTAVDGVAKHRMLRELGAETVEPSAARYDPRATRARSAGSATAPAANDDAAAASGFDVVFDVVGRRTFGRGYRALRRGGRFVSANPRFNLLFRALWARLAGGKRTIVGSAESTPAALAEIETLIASGKLKPVIGRSFALDDIVEAHRYAESGEKIGNVVVRSG